MRDYEVSFYRNKIDSSAWAVSPDPTGLAFPDPSNWDLYLTQMVYPRRAIEGCELRQWEKAFRRDGYCLL